MASKARSQTTDFLVFAIVRLVVAFVQILPYSKARPFFAFLAWLGYRIDKRHREVARENLLYAFPHLKDDPAECDRLIRGCYLHFALMVLEIIYLPRKMSAATWQNYATLIQGGKILDGVLDDSRPQLVVTAHFGNWEMAGYVMGLVGFKTFAIARTLDNPYMERFFKKFRQKTGQTILAKRGDFDNIQHVLEANKTISTLGDQDAGQKGLFVDFFGRPASTHKAIALLALEYDVPMVVVGIPRVSEPMKYEIVVEDVIDPRDYRNSGNAIRQITERYTQALERLIRRHPEQYFWLHRRWKHQPVVRAKRAA